MSQDSEEKIRELEQQVHSLRRLIETIVDQVGQDAERITQLEQEIEQLKRLIRGRQIMTDSQVTHTEHTLPEEDWRVAHTRIEEKLRRNAEIQQRWKSMSSTTLVDAASSLGEPDAPPPTFEELLCLKDNLISHQQAVGKLIELIESLLQSAASASESDDSDC